MAQPLFYTEVKKVDDGTIYQVIDVQNVAAKFAKPVDSYLSVGDDVAFELMRHLNAGDIIKISVADAEAGTHGHSHSLTIDDFTIEEPDTLAKYKEQKFHKVQSIFTLYLTKMGSLAFFNLLNTFSSLAARGYFITDDNREEKYLEIINSGDPELIALLESYLEEYDLIKPISSMYSDLKRFEVDLAAATNETEVDEAAHLFDTAE